MYATLQNKTIIHHFSPNDLHIPKSKQYNTTTENNRNITEICVAESINVGGDQHLCSDTCCVAMEVLS